MPLGRKQEIDKVCVMPASPVYAAVTEGRITRRASNSLTMEFRDRMGDPSAGIVAEALQNGAGGGGSKVATLFGFKNGGTGRHLVTYPDASAFIVESGSGKPTELIRDGQSFATITRGETSTAVAADGSIVLSFLPDPDEAKSYELFRIALADAAGEPIGRLDVVRQHGGWDAVRTLSDIALGYYLWDQTGLPMTIPILGTQFALTRPATAIERDVLIGASVDIAIGLRPYIKAMSN
jgi:hypothetical protein